MKINKHEFNGWYWLSNTQNRMSYIDFQILLNYLKKKFKKSLQYFEDQPVWTFNCNEYEMQAELNNFYKQQNGESNEN